MAGREKDAEFEAGVVVIGGGPAGLSAATEIAQLGGGPVVLLERDTVVGGIPRHCGHSPFGMQEFHRILTGTAYARRLEQDAVAAGVRILTRHSVLSGADGRLIVATPDGIRTLVAPRIVLATGARETPRSARLVSGDRPIGVMNTGALQAYVHQQRLAPFRRPVIVGTELVSMSAILTCLSGGMRPVMVVEKRSQSVARFPFRLLPHVLRIPVRHRTEIVDISGARRVEEVVIETDGQRQPVACDGVIFTGEFTPESALARSLGVEIDADSGGPRIDAYGRTSNPGIFAAGNLLRPVETAGWCWAEARRIARCVVEDLAGRLPTSDDLIEIHAGAGVKLVVPQVLSREGIASSIFDFQVRLDAPSQGWLIVSDGTRVLWSRPLKSGPERRILIPINDIRIDPSIRTITVAVSENKG
jgi:NADPH-dependent 2,4-dienoyl-CoA reductase/sulfur reductase-like enzyme